MPGPFRFSLLTLSAALHAAFAGAQEMPADATVVVLGHGQARQVQNLGRQDLLTALPGTSPLKLLEKLPGVSFQSADALGSYEWSTRIAIRGYSQGQLGFTLDGVPLGNMSYGNNNGLHISRAIIAEDIQGVDVAQGAGAIGTASTSNLGGTVQFYAAAPAAQSGVRLAQTVGNHGARRSYVRLDSGALAPGWQASLSAVRQRDDKWKGAGPEAHDQLNLRVQGQWGAHQLSAFWNLSDKTETDYQDLSPEMQGRLGWDWDNYAPDWARAVAAARGQFSGGVNNLDDAYYMANGLRKDRLGALQGEFELGRAQLLLQAYHHGNDGQGHWYTPYQASSATVPISIRTTEYEIQRNGLQAALSWQWGGHSLRAGVWAEHGVHALTRNYYAVQGPQARVRFLRDPLLTGFRQVFDSWTQQLYLQDSWRLDEGRLKVEAGVKASRATIDTSSINAARAAGRLRASKPLLPQLGATYQLGGSWEGFASAARSYRAYEAGVYGQFSQSQAAFDARAGQLRPETATSVDAGLRYQSARLSAAWAVYQTHFGDRLLSVAECAGVVGCANTVVNVGRVHTQGMEAAVVWRPAPGWSSFASLTWNDSRYRDDYRDGGNLVLVSGKHAVDVPRLMAQTELSYARGPWQWRVQAKYTGPRYYTYLNDGAVAGYTLAAASASVQLGNAGGLRELVLRVNVDNLLNRRYFATIGSNQFVASDPGGQFATMLTGAPRQIFVSLSGRY